MAIGLSPAQILGFVRGGLNALAVGAEAIFYPARRDPLGEAARLGATLALLPSALVPLAGRHGEPAACGCCCAAEGRWTPPAPTVSSASAASSSVPDTA